MPQMGAVMGGKEGFTDMSDRYDPELRQLAREAAREAHVALEEGDYLALLGPSYETPAEIRALARLAADAVGMSTGPEVTAARALGIRCLGSSIGTNPAPGLSAPPLPHMEVLAASPAAAPRLSRR